jgi:hypothetical protein
VTDFPREIFTEEALKAQDGKKVPLTLEPGGPVIGEATLKYVPGEGLDASMRIDNPELAEMLRTDPKVMLGTSSVIFRKER